MQEQDREASLVVYAPYLSDPCSLCTSYVRTHKNMLRREVRHNYVSSDLKQFYIYTHDTTRVRELWASEYPSCERVHRPSHAHSTFFVHVSTSVGRAPSQHAGIFKI